MDDDETTRIGKNNEKENRLHLIKENLRKKHAERLQGIQSKGGFDNNDDDENDTTGLNRFNKYRRSGSERHHRHGASTSTSTCVMSTTGEVPQVPMGLSTVTTTSSYRDQQQKFESRRHQNKSQQLQLKLENKVHDDDDETSSSSVHTKYHSLRQHYSNNAATATGSATTLPLNLDQESIQNNITPSSSSSHSSSYCRENEQKNFQLDLQKHIKTTTTTNSDNNSSSTSSSRSRFLRRSYSGEHFSDDEESNIPLPLRHTTQARSRWKNSEVVVESSSNIVGVKSIDVPPSRLPILPNSTVRNSSSSSILKVSSSKSKERSIKYSPTSVRKRRSTKESSESDVGEDDEDNLNIQHTPISIERKSSLTHSTLKKPSIPLILRQTTTYESDTEEQQQQQQDMTKRKTRSRQRDIEIDSPSTTTATTTTTSLKKKIPSILKKKDEDTQQHSGATVSFDLDELPMSLSSSNLIRTKSSDSNLSYDSETGYWSGDGGIVMGILKNNKNRDDYYKDSDQKSILKPRRSSLGSSMISTISDTSTTTDGLQGILKRKLSYDSSVLRRDGDNTYQYSLSTNSLPTCCGSLSPEPNSILKKKSSSEDLDDFEPPNPKPILKKSISQTEYYSSTTNNSSSSGGVGGGSSVGMMIHNSISSNNTILDYQHQQHRKSSCSSSSLSFDEKDNNPEIIRPILKKSFLNNKGGGGGGGSEQNSYYINENNINCSSPGSSSSSSSSTTTITPSTYSSVSSSSKQLHRSGSILKSSSVSSDIDTCHYTNNSNNLLSDSILKRNHQTSFLNNSSISSSTSTSPPPPPPSLHTRLSWGELGSSHDHHHHHGSSLQSSQSSSPHHPIHKNNICDLYYENKTYENTSTSSRHPNRRRDSEPNYYYNHIKSGEGEFKSKAGIILYDSCVGGSTTTTAPPTPNPFSPGTTTPTTTLVPTSSDKKILRCVDKDKDDDDDDDGIEDTFHSLEDEDIIKTMDSTLDRTESQEDIIMNLTVAEKRSLFMQMERESLQEKSSSIINNNNSRKMKRFSTQPVTTGEVEEASKMFKKGYENYHQHNNSTTTSTSTSVKILKKECDNNINISSSLKKNMNTPPAPVVQSSLLLKRNPVAVAVVGVKSKNEILLSDKSTSLRKTSAVSSSTIGDYLEAAQTIKSKSRIQGPHSFENTEKIIILPKEKEMEKTRTTTTIKKIEIGREIPPTTITATATTTATTTTSVEKHSSVSSVNHRFNTTPTPTAITTATIIIPKRRRTTIAHSPSPSSSIFVTTTTTTTPPCTTTTPPISNIIEKMKLKLIESEKQQQQQQPHRHPPLKNNDEFDPCKLSLIDRVRMFNGLGATNNTTTTSAQSSSKLSFKKSVTSKRFTTQPVTTLEHLQCQEEYDPPKSTTTTMPNSRNNNGSGTVRDEEGQLCEVECVQGFTAGDAGAGAATGDDDDDEDDNDEEKDAENDNIPTPPSCSPPPPPVPKPRVKGKELITPTTTTTTTTATTCSTLGPSSSSSHLLKKEDNQKQQQQQQKQVQPQHQQQSIIESLTLKTTTKQPIDLLNLDLNTTKVNDINNSGTSSSSINNSALSGSLVSGIVQHKLLPTTTSLNSEEEEDVEEEEEEMPEKLCSTEIGIGHGHGHGHVHVGGGGGIIMSMNQRDNRRSPPPPQEEEQEQESSPEESDEDESSGDSNEKLSFMKKRMSKSSSCTFTEMSNNIGIDDSVVLLQQQQQQQQQLKNNTSIIAEKIAALRNNGEINWKKRLSDKIQITGGTDQNDNLDLKKNNKDSNLLATRLSLLEKSQDGWKKRISENDATLFTVQGKLEKAGKIEKKDKDKESSSFNPLLNIEKKLKGLKLSTSTRFRSSKNNTGEVVVLSSSPTATAGDDELDNNGKKLLILNNIKNDEEIFNDENNIKNKIKTKKETTTTTTTTTTKMSHILKSSSSSYDSEDEKVLRNIVQNDNETFTQFFKSSSTGGPPGTTTTTTNKIQIDESSFDSISSNVGQLLGLKRNIKINRKYNDIKNPIKLLASRITTTSQSYFEISPEIREKEMKKKIQIENLSKTSHLSVEALAGLASKEDFTAVKLKKAKNESNKEFPHPMLICIKGKRFVQTRLILPQVKSISSGDCYVLVTPNKVYEYIGEFSNRMEKSKLSDVVTHIINKKDLGVNSTTTTTTIEEPILYEGGNDIQTFYKLLGGGSKLEIDQLGDEHDELHEMNMIRMNKVYEVDEISKQLIPLYNENGWGTQPKYSMLKEDRVLVFDFGTEMYIWSGSRADSLLKKIGYKLAKEMYEDNTIHIDDILENLENNINNIRPNWCWLKKINQYMEPILFIEKFFDWPDESGRVIKIYQNNNKRNNDTIIDGSFHFQSCNVDDMINSLINVEDPTLELEGIDVCRANIMTEDNKERKYTVATMDVKLWNISEFSKSDVDTKSFGHFYSNETYVIRWQYRITQVGRDLKGNLSKHCGVLGRERTAYLFWHGKDSRITEQGTSALMTVELDQEKGPQIRVEQGREPPCFLALFKGLMFIHSGVSTMKKDTRLYVAMGSIEDEGHMIEVQMDSSSFRSRGSFILINYIKKMVYIWHGYLSTKTCKKIAQVAGKYIFELNKEFKGSPIEMNEGDECKSFLESIGISSLLKWRESYVSLIGRMDYKDVHVFQFTSITGNLNAIPILCPKRKIGIQNPFPILQEELYEAQQPSLFLITTGVETWLWQGWKPRGCEENENTITGSGEFRWSAERKAALETTLNFSMQENTCSFLINAGLEPPLFKILFPYWKMYDEVMETNILEGKKNYGAEEIEIALEKFLKTTYTLDELQERPEGVDVSKLESYLNDEDFENLLKMNRETFGKLQGWRQTELKKIAGLF